MRAMCEGETGLRSATLHSWLNESSPPARCELQRLDDHALAAAADEVRQALGYGRSIGDAFDLGRNEIRLQNLPGPMTPELMAKVGVEPAKVVLANPS